MNVSNQIADTTAIQAAITGLDIADMVELNKFLVGRINHHRRLQAQKMKRQLFIGTPVQFENNDGNVVQGKVIKIMRKFAQVRVETGPGQMSETWRVPMNVLTKVSSAS